MLRFRNFGGMRYQQDVAFSQLKLECDIHVVAFTIQWALTSTLIKHSGLLGNLKSSKHENPHNIKYCAESKLDTVHTWAGVDQLVNYDAKYRSAILQCSTALNGKYNFITILALLLRLLSLGWRQCVVRAGARRAEIRVSAATGHCVYKWPMAEHVDDKRRISHESPASIWTAFGSWGRKRAPTDVASII